MESEKTTPQVNTTQELPREDELTLLRKQVEELKREKEQREFNESLGNKIEEIVNQRLSERENSERQKIEEARKMIEEADRNAAMEQEILQNERYNQISTWRENKLNELRDEIDKLARMGHNTEHPMNMYRDYDAYMRMAAAKDQRGINALGNIKLIHAAMSLGGEKLVEVFKRNIGIDK